jgi:TolB-like protein
MVPAHLDHALKRALAKAPADRYPTAAQFAAAVRSAMLAGTTTAAPGRARIRRTVALVTIVFALACLTWLGFGWIRDGERNAGVLPRLAVVPFENLGTGVDDYFSEGISDELLAKLAGVRGLTVIARQSAMQYKGSEKSAKRIGDELGVSYLLSGTIRLQRLPDGSSRVRVTPQLIRTSDEAQLWSDTFDEAMSDVFRVQSVIAERVVRASGVALLSGEQQALQSRPTQNLEAYEYFLRGNAYFREGFPVRPVLRDAIAMYEKAVELDSNFALAYARLSMAHGGLRWGDHDPSAERLAMQEAAARRALNLEPHLPEARAALALYYYWGHLDYDRALNELAPALEAQPNNGELINAAAAILRRRGDFQQAAADFARASDLDPLGWSPALEAGNTYTMLRRYAEAEKYLSRWAALQRADVSVAYVRLMRGDGVGPTRAWLQQRVGSDNFARHIADAALSVGNGRAAALVRSLCGDCRDALTTDLGLDYDPGPVGRFMGRALLHSVMSEPKLARVYYDSALRRLTAASNDQATPDYQLLAEVYAGLGKKEEAVRFAEQAVAVRTGDAWAMVFAMETLAETYAKVGDYNSALKQLDWLLNNPSFFSPGRLRADPLWDPLRSDPRFLRLLAVNRN